MDRRQPATNSGRNSRSVRAIAFVCGDERTTQRGIPHCDLTDHRTEALQLSRGTADYAFMMDADDLQALTGIDVEINRPTWSRIYSGWSNDWIVKDKER